MYLASIDIGSNAARLLISSIHYNEKKQPVFSKANLVRVPLRLGMDVFAKGVISDERKHMLVHTMHAYRHILDAYGVKYLKACATSAMRDAANAREIIQQVRKETRIDIEVISGQQEATYIQANHTAEEMSKDNSYLYIDVGGGSTEITAFYRGKQTFRQSFDIGTIRLMQNSVASTTWEYMKTSLKTKLKTNGNMVAIGSGGNINKIASMAKVKTGQPLSIGTLTNYYNQLDRLSVAERIVNFKMREDRADVIVPALDIYINAMKWAGIKSIYIPQIGLVDGLIKYLFEDLKKNNLLPKIL